MGLSSLDRNKEDSGIDEVETDDSGGVSEKDDPVGTGPV